jgi:hypothetical protein
MVVFITCLVVIFCIAMGVLILRIVTMQREISNEDAEHEMEHAKWRKYVDAAKAEITRLAKFRNIADADAEAAKIRTQNAQLIERAQAEAAALARKALAEVEAIRKEAGEVLKRAETEAKDIVGEARKEAKDIKEKANAASAVANDIISDAQKKARAIAGEAIDAKRNAHLYERALQAMKNVVDGYGNQYVLPERNLLDELAEEVGHAEAGQQLKAARERTRAIVRRGNAADCDETDKDNRKRLTAFVVDAFNDKVDLILSRAKRDNVGTLTQEIRDAFDLVNFGGGLVGNARITGDYLDARLQELRWAAIAQWLKEEEREEQRRIKEKMRDEQKAAKEYAKAMREAAKEEELIKSMMAKTQEQVARATAEQKAVYERQLSELQQRLQEAEERNQRAISMAQQTKKGHVYIISNIGSFGENVYKIGLTRRLEPTERIDELGDSSVPFDFDVHALMMSDDAPALEARLHRHFVLAQVNKVNYRKEFFRTDLQHVRQEVEKMGITVTWTMKAAATEYWETRAIERKIKDDPVARDAWVKRQLELDPTEMTAVEVVGTDDE